MGHDCVMSVESSGIEKLQICTETLCEFFAAVKQFAAVCPYNSSLLFAGRISVTLASVVFFCVLLFKTQQEERSSFQAYSMATWSITGFFFPPK